MKLALLPLALVLISLSAQASETQTQPALAYECISQMLQGANSEWNYDLSPRQIDEILATGDNRTATVLNFNEICQGRAGKSTF
jgi:hypothetical protein